VRAKGSELKRRLLELHAELARIGALDDDSRELLEDVRRDIEAALAREGDAGEPSLRDRLEAAIRHFEASHPVLTATMGRVIDQLANMGI
jgi:hypothetical protein